MLKPTKRRRRGPTGPRTFEERRRAGYVFVGYYAREEGTRFWAVVHVSKDYAAEMLKNYPSAVKDRTMKRVQRDWDGSWVVPRTS